MTKTAPLKLLVAILITFILILPEYFKTPKGNTLKLSCQEVCLQPNFTFLLSSLNFSFMTLLQPIREAQTVMGIFLNHSNFPNFTMVCEGITSDFQKPSSCLVCESKGNMDFISLKQTSKVLIMRRAMEVEANDCHSPCQHYNFTVAPIIGHLEEYIATCTLKTHPRKSAVTEEDLTKEKPINHTCRILEDPNKCINISLHLEMDVKHFTCSMKITWYILVLSVFIVMIILIIYKILEGHRKVWKWQRHNYKTSVLLRGNDSEKLRALNVHVMSETMQRRPLAQVEEALPPIPELEVYSVVHREQCARLSL
ncbi:transmembrane protein 156 isoform X2 [Tamandua tetradactyla]|uniref:transmembrane protein 156 isoform X2 n=1 Tax=Tamandua tetradactyla TaxID=48850 RepID=UPI004053C83F